MQVLDTVSKRHASGGEEKLTNLYMPDILILRKHFPGNVFRSGDIHASQSGWVLGMAISRFFRTIAQPFPL